ncbi:hypothetical protein RDWZM_010572 [Blomia tropicalis]|uniref:Uncharacterized protein n=1 Tax=Blomia tropicalis TaxID=40697 RepID=A0A9Q0M1A3_BLOTA|nr:hypothetical protein RDWZM_010572 [Blomia tropicalis]
MNIGNLSPKRLKTTTPSFASFNRSSFNERFLDNSFDRLLPNSYNVQSFRNNVDYCPITMPTGIHIENNNHGYKPPSEDKTEKEPIKTDKERMSTFIRAVFALIICLFILNHWKCPTEIFKIFQDLLKAV